VPNRGVRDIAISPENTARLSVGVDVGGTFTDVVVLDEEGGTLSVLKVPTSKNPESAVVAGVHRMVPEGGRISFVSHATTIATNALLTRNGLARTALITNEGFRDILEIGRQRRPELYNLLTRRPPPLVRRRNRFAVGCRIAADGSVLQPLDARGAERVALGMVREGFDSVAVCFLHSYANRAHEVQMRRVMRSCGFRGHVSLSSEIDDEYREYERTSTTVVNASLAPLVSSYLSGLRRSLSAKGVRAPIYVMNSDGGMGTLRTASERPVSAIESGPAAGVMASMVLARRLSIEKVLTFDMGGTTAKAGTVIGGEPDTTYEFEAAGRTHSGRSISGSGYVVRGPFVDVAEVSAGGGTVAWVDEGRALRIGPISAGSEPGPACYGRGGTEATVTDANVVLGRLNPNYLLGGAMRIHRELAETAIVGLAEKLATSPLKAAAGVIRHTNADMSRAMSIVSRERGRDPREFSIIAFGGAGPIHCCDVAEELGVREIIVPVHAGLFSAYGLLAGQLSRTFTMAVPGNRCAVSEYLARLKGEATKEMQRDGFPDFISRGYVDARYVGQSHELTLPFSRDSALKASFDRMHKRLYGYSIPGAVEVVNARLKVSVKRRGAARLSSNWGSGGGKRQSRSVWFPARRLRVPVYIREEMKAGYDGTGPCVIEEYDSTLVVNPNWRWRLEEYGTRLAR
jgi:N-methylhydantoinase A